MKAGKRRGLEALADKRGVFAALEDWLSGEGMRNIENVNRHLGAARPCY